MTPEANNLVRRKDLLGKRFGRLVVKSFDGIHAGQRSKWVCLCDCGNEVSVFASGLTTKHTQSCGCLQKEIVRNNATTHGYGRHGCSEEYRIWINIKSRCYNAGSTGYENYGGRGIKMCDRWKSSFENFLADMGIRPTAKHSIDRFPDRNGDYEPDNCRWATDNEQILNRSYTVWVEYNGEVMCHAEFKRRIGIKSQYSLTLIKKGWSGDKIAEYYKKRNNGI